MGGDYFAKHVNVLAMDGRLLHIATTTGNKMELDLRALIAKRLVLTGSTLRSRSVEEKTDLRDGLEKNLWPLVQKGKIRPILDSVFSYFEALPISRRIYVWRGPSGQRSAGCSCPSSNASTSSTV